MKHRRRFPLIGLALSLAVAGCNSMSSGGDGPDSRPAVVSDSDDGAADGEAAIAIAESELGLAKREADSSAARRGWALVGAGVGSQNRGKP